MYIIDQHLTRSDISSVGLKNAVGDLASWYAAAMKTNKYLDYVAILVTHSDTETGRLHYLEGDVRGKDPVDSIDNVSVINNKTFRAGISNPSYI